MLGYTFETLKETTRVEDVLRLVRGQPIGLDTESQGPTLIQPTLDAKGRTKYKKFLNMYHSDTVGFSFCVPSTKKAYYVPLLHARGNYPYLEGVRLLRGLLSAAKRVYIHNLKHELLALKQLGIRLPIDRSGKIRCTQVAAYITNTYSPEGKLGLKQLSSHVLNHEMSSFETVVGGQSGYFGLLDPHGEEAQHYACEDAVAALELGLVLDKKITTWKLDDWYDGVELPYIACLRDMTDAGIPIDKEVATTLAQESLGVVRATQMEFDNLSDGLNPKSPKQMQKLFEDGIWPTVGKATKTGWSTSTDNLEKIAKACSNKRGKALVEILLENRSWAKVYSTYSHGLVRIANQYPDGNLHPDFNHTLTETGRLSSSYPNAQNMPSRGELAGRCMEQFAAPDGQVWLSADYSQIELRVLAHFAGGTLADAYRKNLDIHQQTADLQGCSRDAGKTLNFAVVYGAGPNKLAEQLKIPKKEGKQLLGDYWETRPALPKLFARIKDSAYNKGYVKTLAGRRRYFPNMAGRNRGDLNFKAVNRGVIEMEQLMNAWSDERKAVNCFSYDTEVLTQSGWKSGHQVKDGELLLTKNKDTGGLEWQNAVFKFYPDYDGPVHVWAHKSFHAETTPNHRWLVNTKWGVKDKVVLTEDFRGHGDERIHRTGVYQPPNECCLSDDEIRLVGWSITDSSRKDGTIIVYQAKPEGVKEVDELFRRLGATNKRREQCSQYAWNFGVKISRPISALSPNKILSYDFIWTLSQRQARLLLSVIQLAEGKEVVTSSLAKAERVQAIAYVAGYTSLIGRREPGNVSFSPKVQKEGVRTKKPYFTVRVHSRPFAQVVKGQETIVKGNGVYCPSVPNTFVVARSKGHVYVTGQTVCQGGAADIFKKAMVDLYFKWEHDSHLCSMRAAIHDDLRCLVLDEAPTKEHYSQELKETMESTWNLRVPLVAEPVFGKTWKDLK